MKSVGPIKIVRITQGSKTAQRIMAPVAYYTRAVGVVKHSLWVLVLAIIAVVVWIASDNSGNKGARIVFSNNTASDETGQNIMVKPYYQGVDSNNQPYTVTARQAIQKDDNTVILDAVNADIMQTDGKWLAIKSAFGEYRTDTRQMSLTGGINIFADGEFEFRTDHAHIDLPSGMATGDSHVEGQGPPGTLTADGFSADSKRHVIRFNGSVRMMLYP